MNKLFWIIMLPLWALFLIEESCKHPRRINLMTIYFLRKFQRSYWYFRDIEASCTGVKLQLIQLKFNILIIILKKTLKIEYKWVNMIFTRSRVLWLIFRYMQSPHKAMIFFKIYILLGGSFITPQDSIYNYFHITFFPYIYFFVLSQFSF